MKRISLLGAALALLAACSDNSAPTGVADLPPDVTSAGGQLLLARCSGCHAAPMPSVHDATSWPGVVYRMQVRMSSKGFPPMPGDEIKTLIAYLQTHAAETKQ